MANYEQAIQQLYVAYYNRPADPAGMAFWHGVVEAQGGNTSAVSAAFASSDEYVSVYGGKDNRTVVNTVYRNLFGRDGEKDGVDYWAKALDDRLITVDGVVTAIAAGARNTDLVAFENKVKFATSFTGALDVHPEKAAYNGAEALAFAKQLTSSVTTDVTLATAIRNLDAATADFVAASKAPIVFTMSGGADTGVAFKGGGGNDTFNATGTSFSAGDSINGGGGRNTLVIADDGSALATGAPAGVSVTNIQQVNISTKGGVGNAAVHDMSGYTGLEHVAINAAGAVNVKVADAVELNIATSAGGVTTNGGRAVSVTGNTAAANLSGNALTSVSLANTSQSATINNSTADHTLNLRLSEVGGATVTDASAKTVNLRVDVAQDGLGSNINLAAATATTLNIENHTMFQLTTTALAAADKLASMTLKGAGNFSADLSGIAPLKTIDASQSSGTNSIDVAAVAGLTLKGGSGSDIVSVNGALAGDAVVQLGAGNDHYDFTQAAGSGAKVDAGAGRDTIVANDAALFATSGSPVYSNFEILDFSSGKGVYDLDRVGSVTTLHTHARLRGEVSFTNGRADSRIEMLSLDVNPDLAGTPAEHHIVGANIKFALKDASGSNDKLTISMTANDASVDNRSNGLVKANDFEANGIETITLHSTVNKMEPDNPATSTNEGRVAADYLNSFGFLRAEGSKTVLVTGDASLDMVKVYSDTLLNFDASGSTGNVNFDGVGRSAAAANTGLDYLGSQGTDYYTATTAGGVFQGNGGLKDEVILSRDKQAKDTIVFTKASDSQLIWATPNSKEIANYDVISNFQVGVDKIDLSALDLAAGANLQGFAKFKVASNTSHILQSTLKDGIDVFNDNGVDRSIAFAMWGEDDGWMLVDVNGDGNYTSGTDMAFAMYGNTAIPVLGDFIF